MNIIFKFGLDWENEVVEDLQRSLEDHPVIIPLYAVLFNNMQLIHYTINNI